MKLSNLGLLLTLIVERGVSAPSKRQSARKVGIAWQSALIPWNTASDWNTLSVAGVLNFSPTKSNETSALGVPFVPMLDNSGNTGIWLSTVVQGYATLAIGFSEVDRAGPNAVSVPRGIDTWRQLMAPLKARGYQLCLHTISQANSGKEWLQNFESTCPDCWAQVDFVGVEWFGTDAQDLIDFLQDIHLTSGKNVVLSRFACESFNGGPGCTADQAAALLAAAISYMDAQSFIYMYFWFGMWTPGRGDNATGLMNEDGSPNALGRQYIHS